MALGVGGGWHRSGDYREAVPDQPPPVPPHRPGAEALPPPDAQGPPDSVVVVGAGLAGGRTVAELRAHGFTGRVTLLGAEGLEPYDRPPLSKELLSRDEPVWLRDEADVRLADAVHLARPATGLVVPGTGPVTVTTADGDVVAGAVVLATGAHAVDVPGWEHALTLHTAADADRLRAALRSGRVTSGARPAQRTPRLVVVGAGWIGAEVAGVAAAAGLEVTVVEAAQAPLSAALGPVVGGLTADWYARAGVRLLTGATVVRLDAEGVALEDGTVLEADVTLAAVGARPTSSWLAGTLPLAADGSVLVDEGCRLLPAGPEGPPDPRVLAVGDLARRRSRRHGWVPGGHWDGALRSPAVAVRALVTGTADDVPDPAPYVFSTQLGHELGLYGQPAASDDVVLRGDPADGAPFTALWFSPGTDQLTAVLAVDRPRDVAAARRLMAGADLPHLDRDAAVDPATPLRSATR